MDEIKDTDLKYWYTLRVQQKDLKLIDWMYVTDEQDNILRPFGIHLVIITTIMMGGLIRKLAIS